MTEVKVVDNTVKVSTMIDSSLVVLNIRDQNNSTSLRTSNVTDVEFRVTSVRIVLCLRMLIVSGVVELDTWKMLVASIQ